MNNSHQIAHNTISGRNERLKWFIIGDLGNAVGALDLVDLKSPCLSPEQREQLKAARTIVSKIKDELSIT